MMNYFFNTVLDAHILVKILISVFICESGLQFCFGGTVYQILTSELHLPRKKDLEMAVLSHALWQSLSGSEAA